MKRYALCATICALLLGGCNSDGTGPQPPVPVPARLSFTASIWSLLYACRKPMRAICMPCWRAGFHTRGT